MSGNITVKTIACIESSNYGHRLQLMQETIKGILLAGNNAVCITDNTQPIQAFIQDTLPEYYGKVTYYNYQYLPYKAISWSTKLNDLLYSIHNWKQYQQVLKTVENKIKLKIDLVILHNIDIFLCTLMPIALQQVFFRYQWMAMYIHPRYLRMYKSIGVQEKRARISDIDYLFLSKKCKGVAVFDNGVQQGLQYRIQKKVSLLPDFSYVNLPKNNITWIDEIITQANGRTIVGTIGMNFYGGFVDMVKLVMYCQEKHPEFYFVCCGQFEENIYAEITNKTDAALVRNFRQHPSDNCYWKEGYLADEPTYNAVFNTFDIIYMMYPHHYSSSNRLTKVAYFRKVVLATNQHCVGENVQQYGFGKVASPHNIEEQAQQLVLLAQQLQEKHHSYDRYEEYYTNNSTQAFQAAIRIMLNV